MELFFVPEVPVYANPGFLELLTKSKFCGNTSEEAAEKL